MEVSSFSSFKALLLRAEILGEMRERAHHWIWGETPQSAKRSKLHRVAQVFQDHEIGLAVLSRHDLVDQFHAAGRADPAGRALAARFDGAEFHGETGLFGHVHAVVEHHDAAMADQAVGRGEGLIVERRLEQIAREIGAEWAADLDRAHRAPGAGAAADLVDRALRA